MRQVLDLLHVMALATDDDPARLRGTISVVESELRATRHIFRGKRHTSVTIYDSGDQVRVRDGSPLLTKRIFHMTFSRPRP